MSLHRKDSEGAKKVRDIGVTFLPYQSHPFVHGVCDGPDGASSVWLQSDGTWSEQECADVAKVGVYQWEPPESFDKFMVTSNGLFLRSVAARVLRYMQTSIQQTEQERQYFIRELQEALDRCPQPGTED